jgi:hypothetical protein
MGSIMSIAGGPNSRSGSSALSPSSTDPDDRLPADGFGDEVERGRTDECEATDHLVGRVADETG